MVIDGRQIKNKYTFFPWNFHLNNFPVHCFYFNCDFFSLSCPSALLQVSLYVHVSEFLFMCFCLSFCLCNLLAVWSSLYTWLKDRLSLILDTLIGKRTDSNYSHVIDTFIGPCRGSILSRQSSFISSFLFLFFCCYLNTLNIHMITFFKNVKKLWFCVGSFLSYIN